jgi:hypothetical protein
MAVVILLITLSSCSGEVGKNQKSRGNCGLLPAGFFSPNDYSFWSGRMMGISAPLVNQIAIDANGAIKWNGSEINVAMLEEYLATVTQMNPRPSVALDFKSGTPCGPIIQVRDLMEKILKCSEEKRCLRGDYNGYIRYISRGATGVPPLP